MDEVHRRPTHHVMFPETLAATFDAWAVALKEWASTIRAYLQEAGGTGARLNANAWAHALADLAAVELIGVDRAADPMAAGDALEDAERRLEAATRVFTSEAVRTALARGMSRSYSDSFRVLIRAITAAGAATRACGLAALSASAAAGGAIAAATTPAALSELYGAAQRGAVAAELYAAALLAAARAAATPAARTAAAEQLSAARNLAFGLPADSTNVAAADAAILAEYHPAQAMCFTALAFQPSEADAASDKADAAGAASAAIDISFPQARLAVEYDLAPLTDRRSAQLFGPIASMTTGLNYRLVERLRTIRATPMSARGTPTPRAHDLWPANTPLRVTTGGSGALVAPARTAAWAPFAGARPYTLAYSEAAATAVLAAVRAERADWSLELAQQYGAHVREPAIVASGVGSADVLVRELVRGFELAYDAAPPSTPKAFRALAVGEASDEFALDGYVVAAVARVTEAMTETRLRAELISVSAPRVPYDQLAREMHVTQALRTIDAALSIWRRLRSALHIDADAFDQPAVRRRALLLASFRRAVEGVVGAQPCICAPPSLKLFAASRARGTP